MRHTLAALAPLLLLGVLLATGALPGTIRAQSYPPPVGSLSVGVSDSTPSAGSTTTLTATALDSSGNPVAGATVTFRITSQPGGALFANSLTETTATSGANGVATAALTVGSAPGTIIVEVLSGAKTSQITLQVQSGLPSGGGPPPDLGSSDDNGVAPWQIAMVAGLVILLGGAVLLKVRPRA